MFDKIKKSIVGKILVGYVLIIAIAVITSVASIVVIMNNRAADKQISDIFYPTILGMKEAEILGSECYSLSNNWIYQPNAKEKQRLNTLIVKDIPAFSERLSGVSAGSNIPESKSEAESIIASFQSLRKHIVDLQQLLATDEDYADDTKVDQAINLLDQSITPEYNAANAQIASALQHQNELLAKSKIQKDTNAQWITGIYIANVVLFLLTGAYAARFSMHSISKPIVELSKLIGELSLGKFVQVSMRKSYDELGLMTQAIENMLQGLHKKVEFAESIGKGQYDSSFEFLSEEDVMGMSLVKMRDNLKTAAEEDKKRNWATEGFALFAEVLRKAYTSETQHYDNIVSQLVKYMRSNQGAIFIVQEDDAGQTVGLELMACYAYNRKKFLEKSISIGEGLVGQVYLESETIYMTDVPDQYTTITSGLGEATPHCLIVVPLKINETVYGVLELAQFRTLEQYEIEFLEKLGESIASTISSSKVNIKTKTLLDKTQIQAEEMRAQEEELRQNMEELQATQDEMRRQNHEMEAFTQAVNASCLVMEYDRNGIITKINAKLCESTGYERHEVIGQKFGFLIPPNEQKAGDFEKLWETLSHGEHVTRDVVRQKKNGSKLILRASFMPIFDYNGILDKISIIAFDITSEQVKNTSFNLQEA